MTAHNHRERTPGCFRCEMTSDEIGVAMTDERVHYAMDYARTGGLYSDHPTSREVLTALADEVERLRKWKAEAIEVMDGLQEVGNALGVSPGKRITARETVDKALDLAAERDAAIKRAERAEAEAKVREVAERHGSGHPEYPTISLLDLRAALLPDDEGGR